ncbi:MULTISPECIES: AAA family ATPase [Lysinibacillus]|uniref:AAA family ATPase n=1 Tax=Lysinibacillus TaxID=400634 RepID=UPI002162F22C|nr:AAA family ATPase [Lysinibacillus boronitolerans]MCS1393880.1 AAA family ATPase [Lysinibacillus boronitolerans]
MSKLNAMQILSFRGLSDISLKNFSKINLFVGENNTGKTSLLEAIYLLANYSTKQGFLRLAKMREQYIMERATSTEELISWLFNKTTEPINISYSLDGANKSIQCSLEEKEYIVLSGSSDEYDIKERVVKDQFIKIEETGNKQEKVNIQHEFINSTDKTTEVLEKQKNLFDCHFISAIHHRVEPLSPYIIDDLVKGGERPALIEALRQFDNNIKGIELLMQNGSQKSPKPIPYIQHDDLGLVPISIFGDGVRKALIIASQIIRFKGGVLLIDEIETGIHTKMIPVFFTWLAQICYKHDVQLFATTHSLEALDGMLKATEGDSNQLSVYRLGEANNKKQVKYFSGEKLKVLRYELGQDVR